jgi:hypothetical protein
LVPIHTQPRSVTSGVFDLAREAVPARIDEIECLDGHGPILLAARAIGWAQKEKLSNRQT